LFWQAVGHNQYSLTRLLVYIVVSYQATRIKGHPLIRPLTSKAILLSGPSHQRPSSYQARFQMHWDSKILVNCLVQERPPLLFCHVFHSRRVDLIREGLLYTMGKINGEEDIDPSLVLLLGLWVWSMFLFVLSLVFFPSTISLNRLTLSWFW
jgi:hypothetical protein